MANDYFDTLIMDRYGSPIQDIREESATQHFRIGERFIDLRDPLKRVYRYAKAGAAITPGKMLATAALSGATTTLQTIAAVSVVAAIGDSRIYLTIITTAQAADLFKDGIAVVSDVSATPDDFYTFAVKGNSALATTGTTGYIDLYETLPVALTTSDKVDLTVNPWKDVIIQPVTTHTGSPIGVAPINVTSGYYFWCQTWGPCGIMSNVGPLTIGAGVQSETTIAGGIASFVTGAGYLPQPQIGICLNVGTDVYGATVFLMIAP